MSLKTKFNAMNAGAKQKKTMRGTSMKTIPELWGTSSLTSKSVAVIAAFGLGMSTTVAAYAAIDNSATASGTFGGNTTTSDPSTATVPVSASSPNLAITKTGAMTAVGDVNSNGQIDPGDTITYSYSVQNTGNVTLTAVSPVDTGPTFDGNAGQNTLSGFTLTSASADLAPGETATFTATYLVDALDAYAAAGVTDGVLNTASSTGTLPGAGGAFNDPDTDDAELTVANNPALTVAKAAVLNDEVTGDGLAEESETITYTYTIVNTGNVPLTNVNITDTHEGTVLASTVFDNETVTVAGPLGAAASDIGTADDGVIDTLAPGATATIRYIHTVTQTEVDNG